MSPRNATPKNTPKPDSAAAAKRRSALHVIAVRRSTPPRLSRQALDDLGLPEDLVTEIRGRFAKPTQAAGQDRRDDVSSAVRVPHQLRTVPRAGLG